MEANSTISAWPIVIGSLVIIGVAGYCVYQYMQKKTGHKGGCCKKDSTTKDISPELKRIVKYFSGNMNALRDVSIKPDLSLAKLKAYSRPITSMQLMATALTDSFTAYRTDRERAYCRLEFLGKGFSPT